MTHKVNKLNKEHGDVTEKTNSCQLEMKYSDDAIQILKERFEYYIQDKRELESELKDLGRPRFFEFKVTLHML